MKKLVLSAITAVALFSSAVFFTSCEGEKQGIEIGFNQDMVQIMTILPNNSLRIDTTQLITSNLDSLLAENDLSRDDISEITLATIDVGLCDSLGFDDYNQNFNNWDSVGVEVSVPNDLSVPAVLVAYAKVPQNLWGFGVGLTQQDFDFVPYATKQAFQVRLLSKLTSPITAKKYVKVKVRVNVIGII